MDFNPVTLAIPMYFTLIGIELLADQFQRSRTYRLNDALTNISCGTGSQLTGAFFKIITFGLYVWVYDNFAFFQLPVTWLTFVLVFVLDDLAYYWAHRVSHEVNFFWNTGHVVHHQSEDYNLSVALRQSWFQTFFTFPFTLPLALLGFNPVQLMIAHGINLLYQFWIHTEKIDKLGFLEWFMNTPSHHRVHHGRNPKYIDKNHAGVFIIWDKMFGTFQAEEERPTYGITTPTNSWNPIWVQFKGFFQVMKQVSETPGFLDKLKVMFYKPGWRPASQGGFQPAPEVDKNAYKKYQTNVPNTVNWYVFIHYVFSTIGTAYFFFLEEKIDLGTKFILSLLVVWAIASPGGLFERQRWSYYLEYIRPIVSGAIIVWLIGDNQISNYIWLTTAIITLLSAFWLWSFRNVFNEKTEVLQKA
jgi:sterol desaturase/sphingolipid hydroxylase (fatty acid hydroxylase superfamily)